MTPLLSPVEAFRRVTMRQSVVQRCFEFSPQTVEAGADRDISVTAELENTTDESFDHVWRIEVGGEGLGFTTTTVPPGETVRPTQTRTIPEALLPVDGGFVDVVIQQLGGFQQTTRCGGLEVLPTGVAPGAVSLDGCEIAPREVGPEEFFELTVFVSNGNAVDVTVDVEWTVQGSQILGEPGRTIPAGASRHAISAETSPELARILPGETVAVDVGVTNADLGVSLTGRCGELSVTGGFDAGNVFVPQGECTVDPQEIEPPQDVSLSATVVNDNLLPGIAEVAWVWEGLRIATAEQSVPEESRAVLETTATIEREGNDQVRAEVIRASGGVA